MTGAERIHRAVEFLRLFFPAPPRVGVVLGSGMGAFAERIVGTTVQASDVPGWPRPTVEGHAGKLVLGKNGVVALAGRVHLYEGYEPAEVVFPVRVLVASGCKTIILTNAAGALDARLHPGEMVLLSDHINLTGRSPLVGPNDDKLGPRFCDLSAPYDPELRAAAVLAAEKRNLGTLREGVYAGLCGPTYETPAEVRMLRTLGADLVGMSTVHETIAAVHMGARVLALSCVTNLAAGLASHKLSHDEVLETGRQAAPRLEALLLGILDEVL